MVNDDVYELSFTLTATKVIEEKVMKGVNTPGQSPGPRPLWRPIPRQSRGVLTPSVLYTRSGTEPTSCPAPLTRLRINGMTNRINDKDEKILVSRKNGKLIVKKLYTYHLDRNGKKIRFEMKQESDGSKRIIDILPAFLELTDKQTSKVNIIDEIDRSLHTLLTQQLIAIFLESCSNTSRKQLLFTTHDRNIC